jgi:acyl-CoA dehydrogenase
VAGLAAADHAVVLADDDGEPGAFLVAIGGAGVAVRAVPTTSRQPAAHLSLRDAAAQRLDGDADWLRDALAAWRITLAATLLGVLEGALALAVEHVAGREQFGRPLGTFQSVAHRAADARIAATAIRVTTWHAAQVLDAGADATAAADVARWWAADAGERSVFELVHLHGGLGVDVEHPAHRRLLWARELTTADGGAGAVLDDLGREIAGAARAGTAEVGGAAA